MYKTCNDLRNLKMGMDAKGARIIATSFEKNEARGYDRDVTVKCWTDYFIFEYLFFSKLPKKGGSGAADTYAARYKTKYDALKGDGTCKDPKSPTSPPGTLPIA